MKEEIKNVLENKIEKEDDSNKDKLFGNSDEISLLKYFCLFYEQNIKVILNNFNFFKNILIRNGIIMPCRVILLQILLWEWIKYNTQRIQK